MIYIMAFIIGTVKTVCREERRKKRASKKSKKSK